MDGAGRSVRLLVVVVLVAGWRRAPNRSPDVPPATPDTPLPAPSDGGGAPRRSPLAFCWTNAPAGAFIFDVAASGPSNAWIVGSPGAFALRSDGSAWRRHPFDSPVNISSVWTSGRSDVWLRMSDRAVAHGDGERFGSPWVRAR
jgi:hypothetical protein